MKTWLLWQALKTPPNQALPMMSQASPTSPSRRFQLRRFHILAIVLFLIFGCIGLQSIGSVDGLTILLSSGLVIALGLIGFLILASGTLNGARWAFQVATIMYHDIHDGRYELLSLSPLGVLGALWTISHRQSKVNKIIAFFQTIGFALFLAMLFVGLIFIYTLLQGPPTIFLSQPILGVVLGFGLVTFAFYLDYVQAIVLGHLNGIYFASIADTVIVAEVSAIAVLLAIQIGTYVIGGMVAFLGAVLSTSLFQQTTDAIGLLISLAFIGTAYLFRELAIRLLWRMILTRFAVTHVESSEFHQQIP